MFIRFVTKARIQGSRCRAGIFYVAYRVADEMDYLDEARYELACDWFDENLPFPCRLSRSRRPRAHSAAICWFKPDAHECIQRAMRIASLLESNGIPTAMLRTERPGYIVYEDDLQVAAVPFRDTRA
jgi:hypothetical protein